jgi:hypothetical protein
MDQADNGTGDNAFDMPLRVVYTSPRWLLPCLWLVHTIAALCILAAGISWLLQTLLLIAVYFSLTAYQAGCSSRARPAGFILAPDGRWIVILAGDRHAAVLVSASILLPEWIVLVLKTITGEKHAFVLTAANLDKHTLRRLRVRLNYPK